MQTLLVPTLTLYLSLNWIPSTGQSLNAAGFPADSAYRECRRTVVQMNHELNAAYKQLETTKTALYTLQDTVPVQIKEAERRGWGRGTADAWTSAGAVTGGAVVGGLVGDGRGALIGAGVGLAYSGVAALVRKWRKR